MKAQTKMTITEQLAYSTVRIEVFLAKGSGTGTGFFFNFKIDDKILPVIVTNKHVVKGAIFGEFKLTLKNDDGTPNLNTQIPIRLIDFESRWIKHPDKNVDLVVMPIAPIINEAAKNNKSVFYKSLDETHIPNDSFLKELTPVEEILMVGYPIGLFDRAHNLPLFRKGITATHPNIDYNNNKEFLIDAACYPGSSGSPVVMYNVGSYVNREGNTIMGSTRFALLGILYAGPMYDANGEIIVIDIPTKKDTILNTAIPTNLGYVIKSKELYEFKEILKSLIK